MIKLADQGSVQENHEQEQDETVPAMAMDLPFPKYRTIMSTSTKPGSIARCIHRCYQSPTEAGGWCGCLIVSIVLVNCRKGGPDKGSFALLHRLLPPTVSAFSRSPIESASAATVTHKSDCFRERS